MENQRISPFFKQCFVTFGVSLNLAQFGFVLGYTAILLPQLQAPDSSIIINDVTGSWIAAIPGFALLVGNFTIPALMGKYGRKPAHIFSVICMIIGWACIALANNALTIFLARILQGISLGMSTSLSPILIAEYTSPKNRGAFLSTGSLVMATGTLIVHAVGSYTSWQRTATLCIIITFLDFVIIVLSPESPSWLAAQGRFEDCSKVFHWLRGLNENDELSKMIAANRAGQLKSEPRKNYHCLIDINTKFAYFKRTIVKKEFYMPIFIMIHIYNLSEWSGINILSPYIQDVIARLIDKKSVDVPLLIVSIDVQRIIMNIIAIYIIKKLKRRTILKYTTVMCISVLLATAGYDYAKISKVLPYDSPFVGAILIHLHMFTIATGSVPLPLVLSGEIFPLKYRSLSGAISAVFFSIQFFVTVKTFPYFYKNLGLYGTYIIYASVVTYNLVIAWLFLPETKDKTLQEIEEEFTGRTVRREDVLSAESLVSE